MSDTQGSAEGMASDPGATQVMPVAEVPPADTGVQAGDVSGAGGGGTPPGGSPAPKGMPKWLGILLGVLLGAAVVGGIWFAYNSGRDAGRTENGSAEASATVEVEDDEAVEETATEVAEDTTAEDAAAEDAATDGEATDGGATAESGAPESPSDVEVDGGSDGGSGNTLTLKQKAQVAPALLWTTVATVEGSAGTMTSSDLTLAGGDYRIVVNVTDGKGNAIDVSLVRMSPPAPAAVWWGVPNATTGLAYSSPARTLSAGTYKLILRQVPAGGGTAWKVRFQKHK